MIVQVVFYLKEDSTSQSTKIEIEAESLKGAALGIRKQRGMSQTVVLEDATRGLVVGINSDSIQSFDVKGQIAHG